MKTILLYLVCLILIIGCSPSDSDSEIVDTNVPTSPTLLQAEVISKSQIKLIWTDNSPNENGFKIERQNPNGIFELVGTVGNNITSYNDVGLNKITIYRYRVYSYNSLGTSTNYSNIVSTTTKLTDLQIGSSFQGGLLAYVLKPGDTGYDVNNNVDHGIIVTPQDVTYTYNEDNGEGGTYTVTRSTFVWHSSNTGLTGASGLAVGTGKTNTDNIIALYGNEKNAARICYDLVFGGYSDWFLPSANEMSNIRPSLSGNSLGYWTSTENGVNSARYFGFDGVAYNTILYSNKNSERKILVARYF